MIGLLALECRIDFEVRRGSPDRQRISCNPLVSQLFDQVCANSTHLCNNKKQGTIGLAAHGHAAGRAEVLLG